MRSNCRILAGVAAFALAFPQMALASGDIEEQLRLMNERMSQMENQLQATQDELDESRETIGRQQEVIEKADLGEREGKSGLDDFFTMIEVEGWVAGSWWYNFNNPRDTNAWANSGNNNTGNPSADVGTNPWAYPLHPDHNSFSVDQVWFGIEKPVTEESRAGFRVDMVYGKTASQLQVAGINRVGGLPTDGDSASDFNLFQAYIQYLTPWANTRVRAGKFGTIAGAESVQTTANWQISRGHLWSLMQPITHYGIIVDGEVGMFNWTLGGVNQATCCGIDPDNNDAKSLLAGAGVGGETWSINTSILWGVDDDEFQRPIIPDIEFGEQTGDSAFGETGLLDIVARWDPTDRFGFWINFDYKWAPKNTGFPGATPDAWGLGIAGRVGILENLGFSIRGEMLQSSDGMLGFTDGFAFVDDDLTAVPVSGVDIWGITGTIDWTITEGLVAKAEIRYDSLTCKGCDDQSVFINNNTDDDRFTRSDQLVGGFELVYSF